jgi:stearoyl-CoA desaturase (delta-9 desaturase)
MFQMLHWPYVAFMLAAHALAVAAIWYAATVHFSWATLGLAALWYILCGLSITAGYHRLYSHATYRCHRALHAFCLLFGAASGQNSALKWASDLPQASRARRRGGGPHQHQQKGFWWTHLGWILHKDPPADLSNVRDLESDPLTRLQHRYYCPSASRSEHACRWRSHSCGTILSVRFCGQDFCGSCCNTMRRF